MEKETMGTVISVTKQWWLKVNRKPVRAHAMDGAAFPHTININKKHTERINDTNLFITNLLKFCTLLYKLCASHHPRQRD